MREEAARLDSLTGLRWFAALAVFCSHTAWAWAGTSAAHPFMEIARPGVTGVTFFFVLSGFVLAWSHTPADSPRAFYQRRFARIAPAYWVATIVTVVVFFAGSHRTGGRFVAGDLMSLTFLQAWPTEQFLNYGGLGTGWSLSVEVLFYAVAPFLIAMVLAMPTRRVLIVGAVAYLVAVLWALAWRPPADAGLGFWALYLFPPARLLEFTLGVCACRLVRLGVRLPVQRWQAAALAVAAFLLSGHGPNYFMWTVIPVLPFALLIMVCAQEDAGGRSSWLGSRSMVLLGQWSFAFYLIHPVVIYLLRSSPGGLASGAVVWLVTLAASVAAAELLHVTVERPLERRLRPQTRGHGEHSVAVARSPA